MKKQLFFSLMLLSSQQSFTMNEDINQDSGPYEEIEEFTATEEGNDEQNINDYLKDKNFEFNFLDKKTFNFDPKKFDFKSGSSKSGFGFNDNHHQFFNKTRSFVNGSQQFTPEDIAALQLQNYLVELGMIYLMSNMTGRLVIGENQLNQLIDIYGRVSNDLNQTRLARNQPRLELPTQEDLRLLLFSNFVQNGLNRLNNFTPGQQQAFFNGFLHSTFDQNIIRVASFIAQANPEVTDVPVQGTNVNNVSNNRSKKTTTGLQSGGKNSETIADNSSSMLIYSAIIAAPIIALVTYFWYKDKEVKKSSGRSTQGRHARRQRTQGVH